MRRAVAWSDMPRRKWRCSKSSQVPKSESKCRARDRAGGSINVSCIHLCTQAYRGTETWERMRVRVRILWYCHSAAAYSSHRHGLKGCDVSPVSDVAPVSSSNPASYSPRQSGAATRHASIFRLKLSHSSIVHPTSQVENKTKTETKHRKQDTHVGNGGRRVPQHLCSPPCATPKWRWKHPRQWGRQ
jgi:hypothetical protein